MSHATMLTNLRRLVPLMLLAACGGGNHPPSPPDSTAIRTLAYVVTNCHADATGESWRQELQILQGDRAPITVMKIPTFRLPPVGACQGLGQSRAGSGSVLFGAFQRLGVSPDGSGVAFEVTLEVSTLAPLGFHSPLPPEQEGIFFVRADGSGLRRLGPASQEPAGHLTGVPTEFGFVAFDDPVFAFSPDGSVVAFTDHEIGADGQDAIQIVTLDISTGRRTVLTRLPSTAPLDSFNPATPATFGLVFRDNQTILFFSRTNPDGMNPKGTERTFSVKTDGTDLKVLPAPVALPGGFIAVPRITDPSTNLFNVRVPGTPANPRLGNAIFELFIGNGENLLQLTNFGRLDTGAGSLSTDGRRVFFIASANPLGMNPSENCQIFSVDSLGGDLRQLTHFAAAEHSELGCVAFPLPGCYVGADPFGGPFQDPETHALVFDSSCDPLGTNPHGEQFFAMRPDGSGLRQLTFTRGVVTAADGSMDVELPGPQAYSATSGSAF